MGASFSVRQLVHERAWRLRHVAELWAVEPIHNLPYCVAEDPEQEAWHSAEPSPIVALKKQRRG